MDYLFDKADVARCIFETRIDTALEDYTSPDIDDVGVQASIRREARLASEAAKILFEEMEEAGIEPMFSINDPMEMPDFSTGFPEIQPKRPSANDISSQWLRDIGIDPRGPEGSDV
jgi:hypothetical protein